MSQFLQSYMALYVIMKDIYPWEEHICSQVSQEKNFIVYECFVMFMPLFLWEKCNFFSSCLIRMRWYPFSKWRKQERDNEDLWGEWKIKLIFILSLITFCPIFKFRDFDSWGGTMDKSSSYQACRSEFSPHNSHGGRKYLTSENYLLTSIYVLWYTNADMHRE